MAAVFWVQAKFALTIASQLENLPVSAKQVGQFDRFCDQKVVILTANTSSQRRRSAHAAMARRLPFAEHVLVTDSNHWIMQHDRDLVIRAIMSAIGKPELTTVFVRPARNGNEHTQDGE